MEVEPQAPVRLPSMDMDDEDLALVLQLMAEDAQQAAARACGKGKQREGTVSDAELALRLHAAELREVEDQRLVLSTIEDDLRNSRAVHRVQMEERIASYDYEVAVAISEGRAPPSPPLGLDMDVRMLFVDKTCDDIEEKMRAGVGLEQQRAPKRRRTVGLDLADENDDDFQDDSDADVVFLGKRLKKGESSSWAASRNAPSPGASSSRSKRRAFEPPRPCTSCTDETPAEQLIRAPCDHEYCHDCTTTLFHKAMRDDSLFPPQCCRKPILVDADAAASSGASAVAVLLGRDLVQRYREREVELSTENRTYCHNPRCVAFIVPGCIEDDVGLCIDCGATTCVFCKRAAHPGACPADRDLQRVLQMGRQAGWRRCFRCSAMVELNLGCFHITCRCRAEFCYLCGVQWKQCRCPHWDEGRLIDRAAEIDQRHNGDDDDDPLQGERIDRIVDNLRQRHDCAHDGWHRVRGRFQCESCDHVLPHYIYECDQCQQLACRLCRFNRV